MFQARLNGRQTPLFNQARIHDFRNPIEESYRTSQLNCLAMTETVDHIVMGFQASNISATNLEHYCELRQI
jgi:hypothetical protein